MADTPFEKIKTSWTKRYHTLLEAKGVLASRQNLICLPEGVGHSAGGMTVRQGVNSCTACRDRAEANDPAHPPEARLSVSSSREGRLKMTVVADYVAPAPIEVASQEAVDALISNIKYSAKTEQDLLEMFQLATEVAIIVSCLTWDCRQCEYDYPRYYAIPRSTQPRAGFRLAKGTEVLSMVRWCGLPQIAEPRGGLVGAPYRPGMAWYGVSMV